MQKKIERKDFNLVKNYLLAVYLNICNSLNSKEISVKVIQQPFQKEIKVIMIIHTINMRQKIKNI